MKPRPVSDADLAYWADMDPRPAMFTGPGEIEAGVAPCEAIVTDPPGDPFGLCVRVPVVLEEGDLERLAAGGTLWLSTWGGLPMWMLEVADG